MARRWRDKFTDAGRGVARAVAEQSSFRVHLAIAALVVGSSAALGCDRAEWCAIVGCIAVVFAAEIFNSALETLFHALDDATKSRMRGCLDQAAGAVLVASVGAAIIGALILGPKLLQHAGF
jgi:diacylglycerol kinase (ATP)